MAQQTINIGSSANDGTGDTIRDSFDKANDNFTELYAGLTGLLDFKGSTDCSTNPNYPAASKGDFYLVSVAGKIGGASGTVVEAGDSYFATADNAGGTQASVGTSWTVIQGNITSYVPASGGTFTGDIVVPAEVYGSGWNASNEVPTKNDVYDKIESVVAGVPGTYTDEMARDAIGAALVAGTNVTITVNDGADTITIDATGGGSSSADFIAGQYQAILPVYNSGTPNAIGCTGLFTNVSGRTYGTTDIAERRNGHTLSHSAAGTSGHVKTNGTGVIVGGTSQFKMRIKWSNRTAPSTLVLAAGALGNIAWSFPTIADPSAGTNICIVGFDAADSNLQVMHNDGSGTATKIDLGSNFPARTVGAYYEAIFEADGSGTIAYTVNRYDTATTPATGSFSTDKPVENVYSAGLSAGVSSAQSWSVTFHRFDHIQNHTLGY